MASRKVADLHFEVRWRWDRLQAAAALIGHPIFVTCTLRPPEEQTELYNQGRTTPGPIVTHAEAWESYHQPLVWDAHEEDFKACAVDFAFRPPDDPETEVREDQTGVSWEGPWDVIGSMAEVLGFQWGGRWARGRDMPHVQFTFGKSVGELYAERKRLENRIRSSR